MAETARRDFDIHIEAQREMWRLAEAALRGARGRQTPARYWQPAIDLYETDAAIMAKVEIAGAREGQVRVSLSPNGDALTVYGERHEPSEEHNERTRCYQLEVFYGPFEREIALPPDTKIDRDLATARYSDGMLVVTMPKRRATDEAPKTVVVQ